MFESHAHYDDQRFDKDRDQILNELKNDLDYLVNVGADIKSSKDSVLLSKMYDYIYASVGVHPHNVKNLDDEKIIKLQELIKNNDKVIAVGEIGLDFYYDNSPREEQKKWFKIQLKIAEKYDLPVIIHSRDADQITFDILKKHNVKGVIHCFSGSKELAKEYVKRGFLIGVGGIVTYKNARKLVEVVKEISIDNILIETDAPYLSPEPKRGSRNDSSNLKYIVQKIAEIKNINKDEVVKKTKNNAKKLFNI